MYWTAVIAVGVSVGGGRSGRLCSSESRAGMYWTVVIAVGVSVGGGRFGRLCSSGPQLPVFQPPHQ